MNAATKLALKTFATTMERVSLDIATETQMDLEDLSIEGGFRLSDLPTRLPVAVRQRFAELAKEYIRIGSEFDAIAGAFADVASRAAERKQKEMEAAKPHCKTCGQVVTPKSKKRS
jgi:hypothetical protein